MFADSWWQQTIKNYLQASGRRKKNGGSTRRMEVEQLETRQVPATIYVTNLADGAVDATPTQVIAGKRVADNLRSAVAYSNLTPEADTILLETATYQLSSTFGPDSGILIKNAGKGALTIKNRFGGTNLSTIDGDESTRLFNVYGGSAATMATVFLDRLILREGKAPSPSDNQSIGGAILNLGKLTITNSQFTHNYAFGFGTGQSSDPQDGRGGAIYNGKLATLNIQKSTFDSNIAQGGHGSTSNENYYAGDGEGGAIYTAYGSGATTITDSTFSDNLAIGGDAAVYNYNSYGGYSSVYGAAGDARGGALYAEYASGALSITNTEFGDNRAFGGEGAAFNYGNYGSYGGYGGSSYASVNAGEAQGGAVFIGGNVGRRVTGKPAPVLKITASTFQENEAIGGNALAYNLDAGYYGGGYTYGYAGGAEGGAVFVDSDSNPVTIDNTTFEDNDAFGGDATAIGESYGGYGYYGYGGSAYGYAGGAEGGALAIGGGAGAVTITSSTFNDQNEAVGGDAYAGDDGYGGYDNYNYGYGGRSYAYAGEARGGAVSLGSYTGTLSITSTTFDENEALGGDAYAGGEGYYGSYGSSDAYAGGAEGGALYIGRAAGQVNISASTFSDNGAFGGSAYSGGEGYGYSDSTPGDALGGAISIQESNIPRGLTTTVVTLPRVTIVNSTFAYNRVEGGSAYYSGGEQSGGDAAGGAIHAHYGASVALVNDTIAYNNAIGGEGGYYGYGGEGIGGGVSGFKADIQILNTIIALNEIDYDREVYSSDVFGSMTSKGHNLIGNTDGVDGNPFEETGDLIGNDEDGYLNPQFGVEGLSNHGGLTETLALLPYSPAINAADNVVFNGGAPLTALGLGITKLTTDQRGGSFSRKIFSAVDIGAYELKMNQNKFYAFLSSPTTPLTYYVPSSQGLLSGLDMDSTLPTLPDYQHYHVEVIGSPSFGPGTSLHVNSHGDFSFTMPPGYFKTNSFQFRLTVYNDEEDDIETSLIFTATIQVKPFGLGRGSAGAYGFGGFIPPNFNPPTEGSST